MGFPGLISRLYPYSQEDNLKTDIIIDGPAFAYHVYELSERDAIPSCSPLDRMSYNGLGEKAIAWLDKLESTCCPVTV